MLKIFDRGLLSTLDINNIKIKRDTDRGRTVYILRHYDADVYRFSADEYSTVMTDVVQDILIAQKYQMEMLSNRIDKLESLGNQSAGNEAIAEGPLSESLPLGKASTKKKK